MDENWAGNAQFSPWGKASIASSILIHSRPHLVGSTAFLILHRVVLYIYIYLQFFSATHFEWGQKTILIVTFGFQRNPDVTRSRRSRVRNASSWQLLTIVQPQVLLERDVGRTKVEVSQLAGVWNRLWQPFERHRDGGLRSKQRGWKEVM